MFCFFNKPTWEDHQRSRFISLALSFSILVFEVVKLTPMIWWAKNWSNDSWSSAGCSQRRDPLSWLARLGRLAVNASADLTSCLLTQTAREYFGIPAQGNPRRFSTRTRNALLKWIRGTIFLIKACLRVNLKKNLSIQGFFDEAGTHFVCCPQRLGHRQPPKISIRSRNRVRLACQGRSDCLKFSLAAFQLSVVC